VLSEHDCRLTVHEGSGWTSVKDETAHSQLLAKSPFYLAQVISERKEKKTLVSAHDPYRLHTSRCSAKQAICCPKRIPEFTYLAKMPQPQKGRIFRGEAACSVPLRVHRS
jgi:hypothetical protein